jgi:hypothetical protein
MRWWKARNFLEQGQLQEQRWSYATWRPLFEDATRILYDFKDVNFRFYILARSKDHRASQANVSSLFRR